NRSPLIVAPVIELFALASAMPAPPLKVQVPPEIVPALSVMFWLLEAVVETVNVEVPDSVSNSELLRLWTLRLPVIWMLGLPATLMVTSSLAAGIALVDQFDGSLQFTPSPAPVHATAAKSWRFSRVSYATRTASRVGFLRRIFCASRVFKAELGRTESLLACMASDSFPVRARTIFVGAQIAGCYFGNTCNACAVSGARRQSFQPLPFSQN